MWIDELSRRAEDCSVLGGKLSIGGVSPAAVTDAELRNLKIIRCGGVLRIPIANEEQLLLRCDNGEYAVLGMTEGEIPEDMEAGEICVETENAAVLIKNDGTVKIRGELEIEGSLKVNGRSIDGA